MSPKKTIEIGNRLNDIMAMGSEKRLKIIRNAMKQPVGKSNKKKDN